jgi:hypothetical protein
MIVPNAEKAVVDIRKLRDYCLSPNHEVGKHKARVFEAALNLTEKDAAVLRTALLQAVKVSDFEIGRFDEHGQRYIIDFEFVRRDKRAVVRSIWIIDAGSEIPRLVTCLVI